MYADTEKWTKLNHPELTANQRKDHNHYLKIRSLKFNENGKFENNNIVKDINDDLNITATKKELPIRDNELNNELPIDNSKISKPEHKGNYKGIYSLLLILAIIGLTAGYLYSNGYLNNILDKFKD